MKPHSLAVVCVAVLACAPGASNPVRSGVAPGPLLTGESFASMAGEWTGTLTYLDYQDNETRVTLATDVEFTQAGDGLTYAFLYTEPSGATVGDRGILIVREDGDVTMGDSDFAVENATFDDEGRLNELVLTQRGTDGNRPALIVRTIRVDGAQLSMVQEVLPDGETERFVRNEYSFNRR